jgi:hypothetical protein
MTIRSEDLAAGPYVNLAAGREARVLWVARPGVEGRCDILDGGPGGAGGGEAGDGQTEGKSEAGPLARPRDGAKVEILTRPITGLGERLFIAQLSGLVPGRSYRYAVSCGADRAEGTFQMPPAKGAAGPIRFVSYSDPQGSPQRHGAVARAVRGELPFTFLSISGDLSNDSTLWGLLKSEFFDPARELLRQTALWTARGNHEMEARLFREVFALPEQLCYSFDAGNVHWVTLDPYGVGSTRHKGPGEMADMLAWLRKDIAAAGAEWVIAEYHDPTFNVGGTGSEWGRKDLLPVLEECGVDLVLCGHAHLYERCRPIGPKGRKPIIHITHGGGGGLDYPLAPSPLLEAHYAGLHYCVFTIDGGRLEMVAKTPAGEVLDRMTLVKTGGLYQPEVMARSVDTAVAIGMTKVFKLQRCVFDRVPEAGRLLAGVIPARSFPAGHVVKIEAASGCPWSVREMSFLAGDEPVTLTATPPEGVRLAATPWMGYFEPELKLRITLSQGGATSSCDAVPVLLPADCLSRLHPVPQAVAVPPAPPSLTAGGGPALGGASGWKGVPGLHLPSTNRPSESFRLAWRPDGLYGALSVRCDAIVVNKDKPWEGDCLELNFETDGGRRLSVGMSEARAGKLVLFPPATAGQGLAEQGQGCGEKGRPGMLTPVGALFRDKEVAASWRKTGAGYDIKFFIPAAVLAPVRFEAGGTMGFDYLLYQAGRVTEQFVDGSRFMRAWACPFFWGVLRLAGE